jgi:hypothetical protein
MSIEDRLREALHEEAERVGTDDGAWRAVQGKVRERRRSRRVRGTVLGVAAANAAVAGVAALVVPDDDHQVETVPAAHGTTTLPGSSTVAPTTATSTPTTAAAPWIWPFTSAAQADAYTADPGVGMFFDAEATALEFARSFIGMPAPVTESITDHEDGSTTVVVRPKPASPVKTRIFLTHLGTDHRAWSVEQASTDHIVVDRPAYLAHVTSPLELTGTSIAFEAVVRVEVRQDGQAFGQSLGATTVMGGGTELQPFRGSIAFDRPTARAGTVVFFTDSAEDGSIVEATVVRVAFEQP